MKPFRWSFWQVPWKLVTGNIQQYDLKLWQSNKTTAKAKALSCHEVLLVKFPAGAWCLQSMLLASSMLNLAAVTIQHPKKQFNCSLRIVMNHETRNYHHSASDSSINHSQILKYCLQSPTISRILICQVWSHCMSFWDKRQKHDIDIKGVHQFHCYSTLVD